MSPLCLGGSATDRTCHTNTNLVENKQGHFKWHLDGGFKVAVGTWNRWCCPGRYPGSYRNPLSYELLQNSENGLSKQRFLSCNFRCLRFTFCKAASDVFCGLIQTASRAREGLVAGLRVPSRAIHSKDCPWCFWEGNTLNPSFSFTTFVQETLPNATSSWKQVSFWGRLLVSFLKSRWFWTSP